MTRQETGKIMRIITAAYPKFYANCDEIEKMEALALWSEMFKDCPAKVAAYAVKAFIAEDEKGFPPSIGQIMKRVRMLTEKPQMTAEEAWTLVYQALCRSAWHAEEEFEKLPERVKKVVRTPGQLQAWGLDPQFNAGVESSNFKRAYSSLLEREKRFDALPEDIKAYIEEMRNDTGRITEKG